MILLIIQEARETKYLHMIFHDTSCKMRMTNASTIKTMAISLLCLSVIWDMYFFIIFGF
jgi:hypothetical protein